MGLYIIVSFLLFFSIFMKLPVRYVSLGNEHRGDILYSFPVFLLLFFATIRGKSVGADTKNYIYIFDQICRLKNLNEISLFADKNYIEPGYLLYNILLSKVTCREQAITVLNSLVLFISLCLLLRYTNLKKEALFLFYCLGIYQTGFNLSPSTAASFVALCSLKYIKERKLLKTVVVILIGMSIHRSVFVFILLYFLYEVKLSKKRILLLFLAGYTAYLFYGLLYPTIIRLIPTVYLFYFEVQKNTSNGIVFAFHSFLMLVICMIVDFNNDDPYFNVLLWGVMIELLFYWLSLRLGVFARVSLLFTPCFILLLPLCLRNVKYVKYNLLSICFYGLILVQYILRLCVNNIGTTLPYVTFWNK